MKGTTTEQDSKSSELGNVVRIDDERIQDHLGKVVRGTLEETFSYYAFPDRHWIKLRTNNPLERIMREIRRRPRVVGAFPDARAESDHCGSYPAALK